MAFGFGKKKKTMRALDWIAYVLVIVGAIVWLPVGIADANLLELIFKEVMWVTRAIYILVGLAGLYGIWTFIKLVSRRH